MRLALLTIVCAAPLLSAFACASSNKVPTDAERVGGNTARPTFVSLHPGTIYVREAGSDRVAYSTQIDKGDQVEVDPAAGRVNITGPHAATKTIAPAASYQLYFRPASKREYHPTMAP
jgi:hypothetical protein